MSGFRKRFRGWNSYFMLMARDPHFWITQGFVVAISTAHILLEKAELLRRSPLEFLPISFYWAPILYMALRYGLAGSVITSAAAILTSIPNWAVMERSENLWSEMAIVIIAAIISFLLGRQVDKRVEAQRNAALFAANAVQSQEDERRKLSLELHDDPIQVLISVCHALDTLKDIPPAPHKSILEIRNTIAGTIEKLRTLSISLRPPLLDEMGVVSAIRSLLTESARKAGFTGEFNTDGEPRRLPPEIELGAFRIAQEAINNIVRHAGAKRVQIRIAFSANELSLKVVDDGAGFDVFAVSSDKGGNHIGLLSMQERAIMLSGRIRIDSEPGKGTRITATLPVTP